MNFFLVYASVGMAGWIAFDANSGLAEAARDHTKLTGASRTIVVTASVVFLILIWPLFAVGTILKIFNGRST